MQHLQPNDILTKIENASIEDLFPRKPHAGD
jgi:hypothetical protein